MKTNEPMKINDDEIESKQIDDKILLSIISIVRKKGFDAYLLPQDSKLPMENRREDIFIVRP